ncbi:MAG: ferredoxin--NADP reductase [Saprospiraceae bacterium]|nr:ferredoxin--NADP reductase [Saprospiraceae bacterium]
MNFYSLKIVEVRKETSDAVSLFLEVPSELKETFKYRAGQYLTLRFNLNGEELRRAYSMCSSPLEDHLAVTVKRVPDGRVSTHVNSSIQVGDRIEVSEPEGRFGPKLDGDNRKDYYFVAAGSGITPVYSIMKTILEEEPLSTVSLLYGNRSTDSIIFQEGLERLKARYEGQLFIVHTLSQAPKKKGWFSKGDDQWEGWKGRIDATMLKRFLKEFPGTSSGTSEFFLCGPGAMIELVHATLEKTGIDKRHIHAEYFTTPDEPKSATADTGSVDSLVKAELNGVWVEVRVAPGKTILDALIAQKFDPPYSCTSGSCSTCMAKLQEGKVDMEVCYALDEDEVAEGYILTCQAHPKTAEVKLTYDV